MTYHTNTWRYRWDSPNMPHKGWCWEYMCDLGEPDPKRICEMCGYVGLRYVHILTHDDFQDGEEIEVGSCCADKLTGDYTASSHEKSYKSLAQRRAKWLERNWRLRMRFPECHYLNLEGFYVCVFKRPTGWRWSITHRESRNLYVGNRTLKTSEAAKLDLFDAFQQIRKIRH